MAEVRIRKMLPEDVSRILEIDLRLVGKERSPSWPQRVTRYLEMYYPPLCHVAETNGRIVGFILGDIRGWEYALAPSGWIDIMGVAPDFQGSGIGKKLLKAFADECRERKMKTHIMVREADERLQRFLSEAGFNRGTLIEYEK
ncbi:MAG: GNAT family N-acetyltransferase [Chloroflexi bacterium]|nr:GNAT family N-acetyltransferase [Chloroflexota bacterium]